MNIFRRGLLGLAVLGTAGAGIGVGLAATASASTSQVISTTSELVSNVVVAPNVHAFVLFDYQPSLGAPGFRLFATTTELCVVGGGRVACNWRLTSTGPGNPELTGNAVSTFNGGIGAITGGTGIWRGAKGIDRSINIAPGVDSNTYAFSTP